MCLGFVKRVKTPLGAMLLDRLLANSYGLCHASYLPFRVFANSALHGRRYLQRSLVPPSKPTPDFAFAFDIDGVLLRGSRGLPRAAQALNLLESQRVPYILLTNGGGKSEKEKAAAVGRSLGLSISPNLVIQSHTPYLEYDHLKDKYILVLGGQLDAVRRVAQDYGFKNVITPQDIYNKHRNIWPFSNIFNGYYDMKENQPAVKVNIDPVDTSSNTKIDAIFVYNDPRDWGLDISIVVDCLLSSQGVLGTISPKNNNPNLPNRGYQQDGQPALYFSNPDLWWAASFPLPRLGQGGFRAALEGVWAAVTGGPAQGVELLKTVIGKPSRDTYLFAEKTLEAQRKAMLPSAGSCPPLRKVYMIGDNPESDIQGANNFQSPTGVDWVSVLIKTGVYQSGTPAHKPDVVVDDVYDAVTWGLQDAGMK